MKNYLIQKLTEEGRFFQDVDGYYYFDLGEGQGALATHNLRAIADELDRLNGDDLIKQFKPGDLVIYQGARRTIYDIDEGHGVLALDGDKYISPSHPENRCIVALASECTPVKKSLSPESADKLNTALRKFLMKAEQPSMSGENITAAAWDLRNFLNDRKLLRELQAAAIEYQKQFPSTSVGRKPGP